MATNKIANYGNKQTRKLSVLISTQESKKRIRKLSVTIGKDVIGGIRQTWKRSVAANKGRISRWTHVNKEAVDGSQQSTCAIGGNKHTRNPSVTGSKRATIHIFTFFSLVIFQYVSIVISLI